MSNAIDAELPPVRIPAAIISLIDYPTGCSAFFAGTIFDQLFEIGNPLGCNFDLEQSVARTLK